MSEPEPIFALSPGELLAAIVYPTARLASSDPDPLARAPLLKLLTVRSDARAKVAAATARHGDDLQSALSSARADVARFAAILSDNELLPLATKDEALPSERKPGLIRRLSARWNQQAEPNPRRFVAGAPFLPLPPTPDQLKMQRSRIRAVGELMDSLHDPAVVGPDPQSFWSQVDWTQERIRSGVMKITAEDVPPLENVFERLSTIRYLTVATTAETRAKLVDNLIGARVVSCENVLGDAAKQLGHKLNFPNLTNGSFVDEEVASLEAVLHHWRHEGKPNSVDAALAEEPLASVGDTAARDRTLLMYRLAYEAHDPSTTIADSSKGGEITL